MESEASTSPTGWRRPGCPFGDAPGAWGACPDPETRGASSIEWEVWVKCDKRDAISPFDWPKTGLFERPRHARTTNTTQHEDENARAKTGDLRSAAWLGRRPATREFRVRISWRIRRKANSPQNRFFRYHRRGIPGRLSKNGEIPCQEGGIAVTVNPCLLEFQVCRGRQKSVGRGNP